MSYSYECESSDSEEEFNPRLRRHQQERGVRDLCSECKKFYDSLGMGIYPKQGCKHEVWREKGTKPRPKTPPGFHDLKWFEDLEKEEEEKEKEKTPFFEDSD